MIHSLFFLITNLRKGGCDSMSSLYTGELKWINSDVEVFSVSFNFSLKINCTINEKAIRFKIVNSKILRLLVTRINITAE